MCKNTAKQGVFFSHGGCFTPANLVLSLTATLSKYNKYSENIGVYRGQNTKKTKTTDKMTDKANEDAAFYIQPQKAMGLFHDELKLRGKN